MSTAPRTAPRGRRLRTGTFWLGFAGPGVLLYLAFVTVPTVMALWQSFTNKNVFNPPTRWIGLKNYQDLLADPAFQHALVNTLILAVLTIVVPNVLGLAVAMLIDRSTRLYRALRSVFFVPVILSGVVVSVIWQSILAQGGILDTVLGQLGVHNPPGWLTDRSLALYSVGTVAIWQSLGFCVVVYLAGLQTVPHELNEAAAIDGATPWQRFRAVTWPLLAPAVTINTVMLLINAFKTYDQVQVITNGGPGTDATTTLAYNVVTIGFNENRVGYASTYAVVMLVLTAVVSTVTLRFLQRREQNL
ncbi:carbohydrate ABC transporter permease [Streptomyces sp. NRRL WC-3742]|uniref:carbohydrate ABC transporter permease n=1 Tax=Streptomyces sp. NRRL WC-3742 TaxID=1463934 RepID=UPI000AF1DAE5|nr:sugar ABC transporter permease [Streptomyces sp. NRRL WC-3742]